jgi:hypothetical protein
MCATGGCHGGTFNTSHNLNQFSLFHNPIPKRQGQVPGVGCIGMHGALKTRKMVESL